MTVADNIDRAAVLRGHQRQAGCRRFQQRQPERFGERRIDKHATRTRHQPINFRHLVGAVMLRQRHLTIEIIGINGNQQIGQHRARTLVEIADVIAVTGDNQQIRPLAQTRMLGIGFDQRDDIFAMIGARERQNQRFIRFIEKPLDFLGKGRRRIAVSRRMELLEIRARRNHAHPLRQVIIVETILLFDFVVRTGDD